MNVVLALAHFAHAKTFDRFDQQHGRLAFGVHGLVIRRIHFLRVMTAPLQGPNFVVAHVRHHLEGAWVATKEMLAHVGTVVGFESLEVAVQCVHHDFAQGTVFVSCQELVPFAAPNELDDVPAGSTEFTFEFLNNLAVATNGSIQTLQVTVHDEDQVVKILSCGQSNGAQRLHLVHFAIATEHPDFAVLGIGNATSVQVL